MTARLLVVGAVAVLSAAAQSTLPRLYVERSPYTILAWFPDGAGVELDTETTSATQQTSTYGAGMISYGRLNRLVEDSQHKVVFAYELEAESASEPGAVTIRLKPLSSESARDIVDKGRFGGAFLGDRPPTVSAVREFVSVKRGQEVKVEILTNHSTGERVFDVLRPTSEPSPGPGHLRVQSIQRPGRVVRPQELQVTVNGQAVAVRNSWTAGQPARLYLPGFGRYYLSWTALPKFRLAGYVERNRLIFLLDTVYVEITCGTNILGTAERGPVWVYHDPDPVPGLPGAELTVAGNVEALHANK